MNTLIVGSRLGPYEIGELLGTGGMGEVYRAHDTRLNRDVALKALRFGAQEGGRAARLVLEARLISTLHHPHIRAIYDAAEYDGITVVVMECLEGETLDRRLARRSVPLALALTWGEQLASALDEAHGHGIIHHDVKPANVMVTQHGVKLLDFGIATVSTATTTSRDAVNASTVTDSGAIAGTTAYMAPEQLDGSSEDPRSDIFALGVVLYEMLTGRKPFDATTRARMIAAILEHEPPPLMGSTEPIPAAVVRTVMKCLAKDPGERWQSARDLASELGWLARSDNPSRPAGRATVARWRWISAAVAAVMGIAAVGFVSMRPRAESIPMPVRFLSAAPPNSVITVAAGAFAVSPDGRHLAFTASTGGGPRLLWVRALDSFEAHALSGTDEAGFPFWSPDNRTVAFFARGQLKTIDISGTPLQIVSKPGPQAQWGSWGSKGDILYTVAGGRMYRVRAYGGTPELIFSNDQEGGPRVGGPEFLPDGEHYLLGVVEPEKPQDQVGIYVGSFTNAMESFVVRADSQALYAAPGYIIYMRAGSLIAHPFDASRGRTTGEPIVLPEPAAFVRQQRRASFSISQNDVLAYRQGVSMTQLTWFDRSGRRLGVIGGPGRYVNPTIAPDANRIAVTRLGPSLTESDIWVFEPRGERQLTSQPGMEDYGVWSPDGLRLVYSANEQGFQDLYVKESSASAEEPGVAVFKSKRQKVPMDWTRDSQQVVFIDSFLDSAGAMNPRLPQVLKVGDAPVRVEDVTLAKNPAASLHSEDQVQVSPNGRWMAFVSDVSGSAQVYVRAFPDGQRRWQISTEGGFEPKWRGDGRELFYIAADQQIMSVPILVDKESFDSGRAIPLFRANILGAPYQNGIVRNEYAVTPDGQRFLLNEPVEGSAAYAIRVLVNWRSLLNPGRSDQSN
jgi:Tol biopolymer transport system component